jgi:hypothetical protein
MLFIYDKNLKMTIFWFFREILRSKIGDFLTKN